MKEKRSGGGIRENEEKREKIKVYVCDVREESASSIIRCIGVPRDRTNSTIQCITVQHITGCWRRKKDLTLTVSAAAT
jgi:hypothetical protein